MWAEAWHRLKITVNNSDVEVLVWLNVEMIQRITQSIQLKLHYWQPLAPKVISTREQLTITTNAMLPGPPIWALKDRAPIWTMLDAHYYFVGAHASKNICCMQNKFKLNGKSPYDGNVQCTLYNAQAFKLSENKRAQ